MQCLLAMDDLGEGSDYSDAYTDHNRRPSISTVKHLLGWLSTLHAIEPSADFPPNRAMRELNYQHIFDLPLNPNTHATIAGNLGPNAAATAAAFAKDQELAAAAGALGQVYLGEAPFESTPALLHGDYYPGSWLRTETEPAVIDPEFAFVGPAEFDVGVFVAHLMFCGLPLDDATATLRDYDPPPNFEISLALGFAGIELVRRLLGVAQLPLPNDDDTKTEWLDTGRRLALGQGS